MLKYVLAGTTALAIAGGTLAYAQQQDQSGPQRAQRWRASAEDVAALGDARIAGLKAGLKLSAEQEKLWPPVETALRDVYKQRADRVAARNGTDAQANAARPDPIERLARRADRMEKQGSTLKKLADAAGPLYKSLDDGQKRRFVMLARVGGGHEGWRGHHHGGRGGMHHGPRGPQGGEGGQRPL